MSYDPPSNYNPMEKLGFVILNSFGSVWTDTVFPTEQAAADHIVAYFAKFNPAYDFAGKFSIAKGRATYSVDRDFKEPVLVPIAKLMRTH